MSINPIDMISVALYFYNMMGTKELDCQVCPIFCGILSLLTSFSFPLLQLFPIFCIYKYVRMDKELLGLPLDSVCECLYGRRLGNRVCYPGELKHLLGEVV